MSKVPKTIIRTTWKDMMVADDVSKECVGVIVLQIGVHAGAVDYLG